MITSNMLDSMKTWSVAALAGIGSVTANDIAMYLGIALAVVRLPVDVMRLSDDLKKRYKKRRNNKPKSVEE